MTFLSYLVTIIGIPLLLYNVYLETGIATVSAFIIIYVYAIIGVHGNTLYSHKLYDIAKNIQEAVQLIQQRIK